MTKHIHKKFSDEEMKDLFEQYVNKQIKVEHVTTILGIGRARFFTLLKMYKRNPAEFSIEYKRKKPTRGISEKAEKSILEELKKEKKFIEDKDNPIRDYNYAYIKDILKKDYDVSVSSPTIIDRAKKMNFILRKR